MTYSFGTHSTLNKLCSKDVHSVVANDDRDAFIAFTKVRTQVYFWYDDETGAV